MSSGEAPVQHAPMAPESAPCVQLVVVRGPGEGTEIRCRRLISLIGRRSGCKMSLRHQLVDPVHAAILHTGAEVRAVDLATSAGTLLNNLKMQNEVLHDGDVLTIRPWELRVDITLPLNTEGEAFDLDPSPEVIALEHVSTGRILKPDRDICIVGRRKGCDVTISDRRVSRAHALLMNYRGHPTVFDLLSKHGTIVNGDPVGFRVLKNDDVLTIGETRFRVRLVGSQIVQSAAKPAAQAPKPKPPPSRPPATDMIDIGAVEGSQRWRIAEAAEKNNRNR